MPSLIGMAIGLALAAALAGEVIGDAFEEREQATAEWAAVYLADAVAATVADHRACVDPTDPASGSRTAVADGTLCADRTPRYAPDVAICHGQARLGLGLSSDWGSIEDPVTGAFGWEWAAIRQGGALLPGTEIEERLNGLEPSAEIDPATGWVTVTLASDNDAERLFLARMAGSGGSGIVHDAANDELVMAFPAAPDGGLFGTGPRQMDSPAPLAGGPCSRLSRNASHYEYLDPPSLTGEGRWEHPWKS